MNEYSITMKYDVNLLKSLVDEIAANTNTLEAFNIGTCQRENNGKIDYYYIVKIIPSDQVDIPQILEPYKERDTVVWSRRSYARPLRIPGSVSSFLCTMRVCNVVLSSMTCVPNRSPLWRVGIGFFDDFCERLDSGFSIDNPIESSERWESDVSSFNNVVRELKENSYEVDWGWTYLLYIERTSEALCDIAESLLNYRNSDNDLGVFIYNLALVGCKKYRRVQLMTYVEGGDQMTAFYDTCDAFQRAGYKFGEEFFIRRFPRVYVSRTTDEMSKLLDPLSYLHLKKKAYLYSLQIVPHHYKNRQDSLTRITFTDETEQNYLSCSDQIESD